MNASLSTRRRVFCLLIFALGAASVTALSDEEFRTAIEAKIRGFVATPSPNINVEYKAPGAATDVPMSGCFVHVEKAVAATLDYKVNFVTPLETAVLGASNVDINDKDEDFDIQHYVAAFVKSCQQVLDNTQITSVITQVLTEVAGKLEAHVVESKTPNQFLILLAEGADKRSNKAITITLDPTKLTLTFVTNFFQNTYTLSMRHQAFFNKEVEQALTSIVKDLRRMEKLLAFATDGGTTITVTCEGFLGSDFVTKEVQERVGAIGWTMNAANKAITVSGDNQNFEFRCAEAMLGEKIAILKWTLVQKNGDRDGPVLGSQSFFQVSMYDEAAIMEMWMDEQLGFIFQFGASNNPEKAVAGDKAAVGTPEKQEGQDAEEKKDDVDQVDNPEAERRLRMEAGAAEQSKRMDHVAGSGVKVKSRK